MYTHKLFIHTTYILNLLNVTNLNSTTETFDDIFLCCPRGCEASK